MKKKWRRLFDYAVCDHWLEGVLEPLFQPIALQNVYNAQVKQQAISFATTRRHCRSTIRFDPQINRLLWSCLKKTRTLTCWRPCRVCWLVCWWAWGSGVWMWMAHVRHLWWAAGRSAWRQSKPRWPSCSSPFPNCVCPAEASSPWCQNFWGS